MKPVTYRSQCAGRRMRRRLRCLRMWKEWNDSLKVAFKWLFSTGDPRALDIAALLTEKDDNP